MKMMNFVVQMMNVLFKMMDFASKMMAWYCDGRDTTAETGAYSGEYAHVIISYFSRDSGSKFVYTYWPEQVALAKRKPRRQWQVSWGRLTRFCRAASRRAPRNAMFVLKNDDFCTEMMNG